MSTSLGWVCLLWGGVAIGAEPPAAVAADALPEVVAAALVEASPVDVVGGRAVLHVELVLPEGRTLSTEAPHAWSASASGGVELRGRAGRSLDGRFFDVGLYVGADGEVDIDLLVIHCAIDDCQVDSRRVTVPVRAGGIVEDARVRVAVGG